MDFRLTDEQVEMQEAVRRFAEKEILPLAEKIDQECWWPQELFEQMGEMGLLGVVIPEEYGGLGSDMLTYCLVGEELSFASASLALSAGAHSVLCGHNLLTNGSEDQKKKYLPGIVSGTTIGAIAMTEPNAGSDVLGMQMSAELRDGEYVLNGTKTFITNGPIADIVLVYARTDLSGSRYGISQFIVERDFPGFSSGNAFKKMGMRGSPTSELFFDSCRVPAENLVGEENGGLGILMGGLDVERAISGAMGVGIARAAFEASAKYAVERTQFGRSIGQFEMIAEKLADMSMEIEAARLLTFKVATMCDAGEFANKEASHAKLFSSELGVRAANEAVQILGGFGYMQEAGVERLMRDAKLMTIGGGTSEIQRLIIARQIMQEYGGEGPRF